jgi:ATP-dependent Clp endopeptidase proteolytic subunit ClpP
MTKKKLNTDEIEHFIDNDLYVPTRTVYIGPTTEDGETNILMAERAMKILHILDSKSADPIEVLMINPGGDFEAGLAIYDAIQLCRSPITVKIFGYAYSMGAVILQAADERILAPNARIMIHPKIIENWAKRYKKDSSWMKEVFLEKIREKNPDFKSDKLEKMLDFDTILSAEDAVNLGLADKVMEIAKGHKQEGQD